MKNYLKEQDEWIKKYNIKRGDKLLVMRRHTTEELLEYRGAFIEWADCPPNEEEMNATIGKTCIIVSVANYGIIMTCAEVCSRTYTYPFFILVPAKETQLQIF